MVVLTHDNYRPDRWQTLLVYWAALIWTALVNIWGSRLLPKANILAGVLHVAGFFILLIILGVMAPKNNASFVFTEITNTSGWSNTGVSWLVGLLSGVYPLLGYDAACHLAEEIPHASRNVPLAMVCSLHASLSPFLREQKSFSQGLYFCADLFVCVYRSEVCS